MRPTRPVLALVLLAAVPAAAAPNVVLIVADDLGQRDLGCYGSTYHKTPHLDALARQGVAIVDAYAACPVCSPTRAALLTGRHPARLNITDWIPGRPDRPDQKLCRPKILNALPLEEVTLAEVLKKNGYATAHIGKWHLGGTGFGPLEQGFDVNVGGDEFGQPPTYFAPYRNAARGLPGIADAPDGEYLTDRLTVEAETFIAAHKDGPFFLYLPHFAVHTPLQAKQELRAKYEPGRPGAQGNPVYAAMLESLDESVGRILRTLDELELAERTIVIFTSDNGGLVTGEGAIDGIPATNNSPYREGKGFLYEGGLRVPFILRGPGITTGGFTMTSLDVFPTVLGLCGIGQDGPVDGRNLAAALGGSAAIDPAVDVHHWHYPHYANQGSRPSGAIRIGTMKLIEFYDTGRRELYDLSRDIRESRNLAAERADLVQSLATALDDWRKDVGARMPTPNPDYKPGRQAQDGTVLLLGAHADVHGTQLRFEPLPHKNTLGFWTRMEDHATFEFTLDRPGRFTVEVLQGCGRGSGGAEVEISVGESSCSFVVEDTGGFQNFKAREVGTLDIPTAGRHTLTVKPRTKPGAAVMDLRQVALKPIK